MNEWHDRTVDEPHPAEDRPVAGWGEHAEGTPAGENAEETRTDGEPLVGEVWNQDGTAENEQAGAPGSFGASTAEAERAEDAEDEHHEGHVGEPFGTEEPMIVTEPADETDETDEAEHTDETDDADAEHAEETDEADPVEAEHEDTVDGEPVAATEGEAVAADETDEADAETADDVEPVAVAVPVDAGADTAAEPVAEAAAEPVAGERPTAADDLTVDTLVQADAAGRFRDRWRDVKATFVDDPADAVRQASALSGEAVEELTAALARLRQNLDDHWEEGTDSDTERLRVALRGYGSLIDRILSR